MIPSPILKVLSTMQAHRVQALLMGGQACVFYGGAEFSRDTDLAVLSTSENLEVLKTALRELEANCIAVPPLSKDYLERGHAVHFRSQHPEARGMRIDVMAVLRGVDPFPLLWKRRTTITESDGTAYDLLSLPDLVKAKKTQRDKDWPMIRRLMEAHYFEHRGAPTPERIFFWLRELRTADLLEEAARAHPAQCQDLVHERGLLSLAVSHSIQELTVALEVEKEHERDLDRNYWRPLKAELEKLRREKS